MDANRFLDAIKLAFESGDLEDLTQLCAAVGGANHLLCKLDATIWSKALENAGADWFLTWPKAPFVAIDATTLFLGSSENPDPSTQYLVRRMMRLSRAIADISKATDLSDPTFEPILISLVEDDLTTRTQIFVTNWDGLQGSNCCVAEVAEELGLGDQQVEKDDKRIALTLTVHGKLHRPTWIDSGFWLYWMHNLVEADNYGYSRHLVTGRRGQKEWVCRPSDTAVQSAKLIRAKRAANYTLGNLPTSYWEGTRQWVEDCRKRVLAA